MKKIFNLFYYLGRNDKRLLKYQSMIRRMVNYKSPRKSPRTKKINNKKSKTSQILNVIEKLAQRERQLKVELAQLKVELIQVRKQKHMLYNSLTKITSPRKL